MNIIRQIQLIQNQQITKVKIRNKEKLEIKSFSFVDPEKYYLNGIK